MQIRLILSLALAAATMAAADTSFAVLRTHGLYESDGNILYSVYLASQTEKLSGVAVGGVVPVGTRFLETVDTPRGVRFEGVRDNVAAWYLEELEADTVIGPFTYRVRPDGAAAPPIAPAAAARYTKPEAGLVEYAGIETALPKLSDSGSVSFDQRGTLDAEGRNMPILVGTTGVVLYVPAGAVDRQVTIGFERSRVEDAGLPADGTWWCGAYKIILDVPPDSIRGLSFALPTRRALPPGLVTSVAWNSADGWLPATASKQPTFGFGNSSFGCTSTFGLTTCSSGFQCQFGCFPPAPTCQFNCFPGFGGFGFGVRDSDRVRGVVSGSALQMNSGFRLTAAESIQDGTSNITDGTSNTIIAILIGRRP